MAFIWRTLFQRRWLFCIYGIVGFFILISLMGFSPTDQFMGTNRWFNDEDAALEIRVIPCIPKTNIVFLKTHKCASSSVQNILLRYAHQNNLTVVLPVSSKTHYLSRLKPFSKDMISGAPWEVLGYNILCHHMIFNSTAVEQIMPRNSLYFSIVRDPVSLFESMYEYDQLQDFYKMDIDEYARATKNRSATKIHLRSDGLGRNQMLYDFGVRPNYFKNHDAIREAIKKIDQRFDFVMIAERFDESIVLLRHILCWDMDDVISLTVNARMKTYKRNLSEETAAKLRDWHWGDQLLYDHFLQRFEETVEEFGKAKLAKEVELLRQRRQEWFDGCVEKEVESKDLTTYKIWSNKVVGFKLKSNLGPNNTCEDLVKPEKFFTNQMRQHQLVRSLAHGVVPNRKFMSAYKMIDLSKLRGQELEDAKKILSTQYRYKRRKTPVLPVLKKKTPINKVKKKS